jgi:hypothetical protein
MGYTHPAVKVFMPANAKTPVYAPFVERYPPDATSMIFWLKNRQPEKWRDRREDPTAPPESEKAELLRELAERLPD